MESLAPETLRPDHDPRARNESGQNAAVWANPVVVDRPFQKKRGRNQQRDYADSAEELGANAVFQRPLGLGKMLSKVRRRWIFSRWGCGWPRWRRLGLLQSRGWVCS